MLKNPAAAPFTKPPFPTVCFWALMASAVREQGKVSVSAGGIVKEMGVGECGRPRCPCHGEVELVTIARTSGAFCPTCASSGWWADIPQPQDKLQVDVAAFRVDFVFYFRLVVSLFIRISAVSINIIILIRIRLVNFVILIR